MKDYNKASALYNEWKNLLSQCLNGTYHKEEKYENGMSLNFDSGTYKDFANASFKLILRLMKEEDVYKVDFIIKD